MSKVTRLLMNTGKHYGVSRKLLSEQKTSRCFSQLTPGMTVSSKKKWCTSQQEIISSKLPYSLSTDVVIPEPDKLYSIVEVECRGHEPGVLESYLTFVSTAAGHLNINLEEVIWPRKHIERWTLLKSVHIYGKHRVQYEARTHFLIMKFVKLTESTTDTFLEYIQRNLPEGIAMRVTKHELQKLPEHVTPSSEIVQ